MFIFNRAWTEYSHPVKRLAIYLLLLCFAPQAKALLKIDGTRLIYVGTDKETTLSLTNLGDQDTVVQSWISHEHDTDNGDIPFAIVQPLVRLDRHEHLLLRVLYAGQGLPDDRESLFWLNIMDIPRKPAQADSVQLAVRHRLKLFYRPHGLQGSSSESVQNLVWRKRQGQQLEVINAGTYHLSLVNLEITRGSHTHKLSAYVFLRPGETHTLEAPTALLDGEAQIVFSEINDIGLQKRHSIELQ
jgi:chaperone protein EcpD